MEVFSSFLVDHKHETPFHKHINTYLADIISFRVDYCFLKKPPKTQWISENLVGLARILPFVFGQYFLYFDAGSTTVADAKEDSLLLMRLVNSLYVMIALLMTRETVDTKKLDLHIKIFLTCCHRFSKSFATDDEDGDTAFWETKGNFYSLLNLPAQILRFGNLRWYWDGK